MKTNFIFLFIITISQKYHSSRNQIITALSNTCTITITESHKTSSITHSNSFSSEIPESVKPVSSAGSSTVTSIPTINTPSESSTGPKTSPLETKSSNYKSGILPDNNNSEPSPDHIIDHQLLLLSSSISPENKLSAVSVDGSKMSKITAIKMSYSSWLVTKLIFHNKEWSPEIKL